MSTRSVIVGLLSDGKPWTRMTITKGAVEQGIRATTVPSWLTRAREAGQIGARRAGWDWVYFADQQIANACPEAVLQRISAEMLAHRAKRAEVNGAKGRFATGQKAKRAGSDVPVTIKARPVHDGAVDYSRAKITRAEAPRYDVRYQVDPAARPYGAGFAAIGPGRDVTTGQAWGN